MSTEDPYAAFPRLKPEELTAQLDPRLLNFETTEELEPLEGMIGQDRALRAIRFGLSIRSFGFNLFVAGSPGTGKKTLIRSVVEQIARRQPTPDDVLYVHNFERPDRPRAITVRAGTGVRFRDDMERLVATLREEIPKAFAGEDYEARKSQILQRFQQQRGELIGRVHREARDRNLVVKTAGPQVVTLPAVNGRELTAEEYEALSEAERERFQRDQRALSETIQEVYRELRDLQNEVQERLKDLDRTVALIAAGHYLGALREDYAEFPDLIRYLDDVQRDIVGNIGDFLPAESGEGAPVGADGSDPLIRYRVNVIVDNSRQQGAPVIQETHPTYRNLIGVAEREARMGTLYTDFTMLRAGSVLHANHGYLILDLVDLLSTPFAWDALKRTLQDGRVSIQDPSEQYGLAVTVGLRPEPVPVDLKVVVLGSSELYNLLYRVDEDFQKLFKIKAEFDTVVRKDPVLLEEYPRFVRTLGSKEKLRPFHREAVAALMEHSSRMVSDQGRLSLRFSDVADLIREADHWAAEAGRDLVRREDVERAVSEKIYRSNLYEARLQEMIDEGFVLIDTAGAVTGQVNGLSVYQVGDYTFGKPTRITAQVAVGDEGIVNIEREARLSGSIHDKGVLILTGYLYGKYGTRGPLSLYASICFEQSYSGVDGDSASSTELYALLSALAEVPLRQNLAVTGSVNQKGVIQPIGGVNEKIEGFFATCAAAGLTGEQGVLIPSRNVSNLMLRREVIDAVRQGRFHIFPVETVDQGIELLTGIPAGRREADGTWTAGSIHARVQQRLDAMAEIVKAARR